MHGYYSWFIHQHYCCGLSGNTMFPLYGYIMAVLNHKYKYFL
ncbi:hypothetical protein ACQ27_gp478 [Klebsiella phage K64-1]|nr:hypothetical protein ACQ27_gp478 [Klebsiella phage K64-1]